MLSNGPTYQGSSVYTITMTSGTITDTNLNYPWGTFNEGVQRVYERINRALEPIADGFQKVIDKVIEAFKKTTLYKKLQLQTLKQRWLRSDLPIFTERQLQLLREVAPIERPTFRRRVCALSSSYRVRV
jgi:hypothetical protein